MASKSNYHVVQRGDTLWSIATKYKSKISGSTVNAKVETLVEVNDIDDRNAIAIDQKIYFSSSGLNKDTDSQKTRPEITLLSLQSKDDAADGRTVMAFWDWTRDSTEGYACRWQEYIETAGGVKKWVQNESGDVYVKRYEKRFCYNAYSASANALKVQFMVRPVDKFGSNDKPTFFKAPVGDWSEAKTYDFSDNPPGVPPVPSIEIDPTDKKKLNISIQWDDYKKSDAKHINFDICKNNTTRVDTITNVAIDPDSNHVKANFTVAYGNTYTVRAQSVSAKGKTSAWSAYSSEVATIPVAPKTIEQPYWRKQTDGKILIYLEWSAVTSATQYVIEYTNDEHNFDTGLEGSDGVASLTTIGANTKVEIPISGEGEGIEGRKYFFRVRARKGDDVSDPTSVVSIIIGEPPAAPTTWSSSNSAFVGEPMGFNWTHNARDGSLQYAAELRVKTNDDDPIEKTVINETTAHTGETVVTTTWTLAGELIGTFYSYKGELRFELNTANDRFRNAKIQWQVRTAGITNQVSDTDWSEPRMIYIYEKPELDLSITKDADGEQGFEDVYEDGVFIAPKALRSFPFYIHAKPSFESGDDSVVTCYKVTYDSVTKLYMITSEVIESPSGRLLDGATTTDNDAVYVSDNGSFFYAKRTIQQPIGYNVQIVSKEYYETVDDAGRSKIVNAGDAVYSRYFNADGKPLMVEITADVVDLEPDISYEVICDMGMSTGLSLNASDEFYVFWSDVSYNIDATVTVDTESYTATIIPVCTQPIYYGVNYDPVTNEYTTSDEVIESPIGGPLDGVYTTDGRLVYMSDDGSFYYVKARDNYVDGMTLSVYRSEYNGTFTEIATNIPNNGTAITDPHPALDYARYRIVAKDTDTGALSFYDLSPYEIGCTSVVIQWDEEWRSYDVNGAVSVESPIWSGSMLVLPYNVKISDKRTRDTSRVTYAGREYPVLYHGTAINESSSWSTVIPKDDVDTIYALRRLSLWAGPAYVREPSGMGFWANVAPSFNIDGTSLTIPITLDVTRVEGGV